MAQELRFPCLAMSKEGVGAAAVGGRAGGSGELTAINCYKFCSINNKLHFRFGGAAMRAAPFCKAGGGEDDPLFRARSAPLSPPIFYDRLCVNVSVFPLFFFFFVISVRFMAPKLNLHCYCQLANVLLAIKNRQANLCTTHTHRGTHMYIGLKP